MTQVLDWPSVFDPAIKKIDRSHQVMRLLTGERNGVLGFASVPHEGDSEGFNNIENKMFSSAKNLRKWIDAFIYKKYYHFSFTPQFARDMSSCFDAIHDAFLRGKVPAFNDLFVIHVSQQTTYMVEFESIAGRLTYKSIQLHSDLNAPSSHHFKYKDKPGNIVVSSVTGHDCFNFDNGWHALEAFLDENKMLAFLGVISALFIKFGEISTNRAASNISKEVMPFYNRSTRKDLAKKVVKLKSTWLRNIVVDREISVRGHFRLQPCGEGRKSVKLIYIKPYKKSGYNRANDRWKEMPTDPGLTII